MAQFSKAMELVGSMFVEKVVHYKSSWLPAREIVEAAINKRYEVIIALGSQTFTRRSGPSCSKCH